MPAATSPLLLLHPSSPRCCLCPVPPLLLPFLPAPHTHHAHHHHHTHTRRPATSSTTPTSTSGTTRSPATTPWASSPAQAPTSCCGHEPSSRCAGKKGGKRPTQGRPGAGGQQHPASLNSACSAVSACPPARLPHPPHALLCAGRLVPGVDADRGLCAGHRAEEAQLAVSLRGRVPGGGGGARGSSQLLPAALALVQGTLPGGGWCCAVGG